MTVADHNVAPDVQMGEGVILGAPREARRRGEALQPPEPVVILGGAIISNYVVLYEGVRIGVGCFIDDGVRVGYDTVVGSGSRIEYGAFICDRVVIGHGCVVAGFVGDASRIGDRCIVMGRLVHELSDPRAEWGIEEAAPNIAEGSVVGIGAIVVGGVVVGPRAYVAAGSVVTKDVPPDSVVVGTNRVIAGSEWSGVKLSRDFFLG